MFDGTEISPFAKAASPTFCINYRQDPLLQDMFMIKPLLVPLPGKSTALELMLVALCAIAFGESSLAATPANAPERAPAKECLKNLQAFDSTLRQDGYWLDGSGFSFGYGYPVYGYGYSYGDRYVDGGRYFHARPGYEVRTLIAAARVLGDTGQEEQCESILATARGRYSIYLAELHSGQIPTADVTGWRRKQIESAVPVADSSLAYRSDQLIGASIINEQDESLGSVDDIIISPQSGKIAYLVISHGGLFGIDATYTPVPWSDFKSTTGTNLLVLTSTKATVDAAPQVRRNQLDRGSDFNVRSQKIDTYWSAHIPVAAN
jgi:sporulation protein YlmC with PRC-barrel domain